ncbi:two-component system, chemotaxis family, sensor kinase CheA [Paenibacillus sp. yr247]|uniref:response regulator n=1 Tax=Paenibacillus sp. yr247 TaxID=1761880 RepID=UPI0008912EA8|nr:response regulator [Paenibacillus sp. yr247]SDO99331.1 two-component system, chemotaxis family, sensor kinase CheA [Paenibacillus sp. yr247]
MGKKKRFGIRSKIMLGYIFIIVCISISFTLVFNQVTSMQTDRNYIIEHDFAVHNEINRIEKFVMDMESGQRGYLLTGDPTYLEPYNNGESNWRQSYMTLSQLTRDNAVQEQSLVSIKNSIERWVMQVGGTSAPLMKKIIGPESIDLYDFYLGKQNVEDIRSQLDRFRNIEIGLTKERAKQLDDQNKMLTISLFVMLTVLLIFSLTAALLISQSIVGTIKQVTKSILKLSSFKRDHSLRIHVTMNDEVKDLAEATNMLLENQEEMEWQQRKLAEVVHMLQGISDLETLGTSFISKAAELFGASFGLFYLRSTHEGIDAMIKLASYAVMGESDDIGIQRFRLGEGLIGQCALEKRMFHFMNVPDHYVKITSGLGAVKAQSVLIVPIKHNNEVIAIMELASLNRFTQQQLELLEDILQVLGTIVHSVQTRVEVERLLREYQIMTEELQIQTEELQSQQEELHMTNEQLEEHNRCAVEKSRELERIKVSLEEHAIQLQVSSRYKSEFLANMSHEFRTPLNSVVILSQMLQENKMGTLTKEEEEYARVIHSSGTDLLLLIDDILDLSKVEAGKLDIHVGELNLKELPALIQSQFAKVAEQRNLTFNIERDPKLPDIFHTDEQRLSQILKNLLSNAFKFTHDGSVQVNISMCDSEQISEFLPSAKHRQVLAISVSDTGIGISPNKQMLIFEPFRQADGTTNRKYGGTGLGLSISRELAGLLGGSIGMRSEEGVGSTFTLYVPSLEPGINDFKTALEEAAAAAHLPTLYDSSQGGDNEQAVVLAETSKLKGKKVLVVDDDVRNVFALSNAFEKEGMLVSVAHDGEECLTIIQQDSHIDLILMDMMMPVMDGYEAMRMLRKNTSYEKVPIIALTAKAMKQDRDICLQAGASDYISKPLNLNQLLSLMRVWLAE